MSQPRTVFLFGPPGTGKSALGAAACATLGLQFAEAPANGELPQADVVAVPWSRSRERALWQVARSRGYVLGLWAHPLQLVERSHPPYLCTPSRRMSTQQGFGRTGDATLEFRLLDRQCDAVLTLLGDDLDSAIAALAQEIAEARQPVDREAESVAALESWVQDCVDDYGVKPAPVRVATRAMAQWLLVLEQQGLSPRSLNGMRSDLNAALCLVCGYETVKPSTMLDNFSSPPNTYEFSRKVSDLPAAQERYRRTLSAFGTWLAGRNSPL